MPQWKCHLVRRKEVWATTWTFRIGIVVLLAAVLIPTRAFWLEQLGRSLIHDDTPSVSDVIVVENYDQEYLLFETASRLLRTGISERLIVPTSVFDDPTIPGAVYQGFSEVMLRVARIEHAEILPVSHQEPVTLTVARQVADTLQEQGVRSVIVVAGRFRTRRTYAVYRQVFEPLGIAVTVVAARSSRTPENWWHTTHGVQQVFLEFIKLQYYRLFVFFRGWND